MGDKNGRGELLLSKEGLDEHQGGSGYSLGDCGSAALYSRRPQFGQTSTGPIVDRCDRRGNDKGRPGHTHLIGRGFSGGVQDPADCVFDAPVAAGGSQEQSGIPILATGAVGKTGCEQDSPSVNGT